MWENQTGFDAYLKNPLPTEQETPIDNELKRMEHIMLSLRTQKGIDLEQYEQKFSLDKKTNEKARNSLDSFVKKSSTHK
jgi:coproporphyrinogen III oxidase-like Fe-S oxidoreductase